MKTPLYLDRVTGGVIRPAPRDWPPRVFIVVDGESRGVTRGHTFTMPPGQEKAYRRIDGEKHEAI